MKAAANQQTGLFLVNYSPRQDIYTVVSWVNKLRSFLYCCNRNTDSKKEDQISFHLQSCPFSTEASVRHWSINGWLA